MSQFYFEAVATEGFRGVKMSQPHMTLLLAFYILLWSRAFRGKTQPVFLTKDRRIETYAPFLTFRAANGIAFKLTYHDAHWSWCA